MRRKSCWEVVVEKLGDSVLYDSVVARTARSEMEDIFGHMSTKKELICAYESFELMHEAAVNMLQQLQEKPQVEPIPGYAVLSETRHQPGGRRYAFHPPPAPVEKFVEPHRESSETESEDEDLPQLPKGSGRDKEDERGSGGGSCGSREGSARKKGNPDEDEDEEDNSRSHRTSRGKGTTGRSASSRSRTTDSGGGSGKKSGSKLSSGETSRSSSTGGSKRNSSCSHSFDIDIDIESDIDIDIGAGTAATAAAAASLTQSQAEPATVTAAALSDDMQFLQTPSLRDSIDESSGNCSSIWAPESTSVTDFAAAASESATSSTLNSGEPLDFSAAASAAATCAVAAAATLSRVLVAVHSAWRSSRTWTGHGTSKKFSGNDIIANDVCRKPDLLNNALLLHMQLTCNPLLRISSNQRTCLQEIFEATLLRLPASTDLDIRHDPDLLRVRARLFQEKEEKLELELEPNAAAAAAASATLKLGVRIDCSLERLSTLHAAVNNCFQIMDTLGIPDDKVLRACEDAFAEATAELCYASLFARQYHAADSETSVQPDVDHLDSSLKGV